MSPSAAGCSAQKEYASRDRLDVVVAFEDLERRFEILVAVLAASRRGSR